MLDYLVADPNGEAPTRIRKISGSDGQSAF